jgi:hypothetical protein
MKKTICIISCIVLLSCKTALIKNDSLVKEVYPRPTSVASEELVEVVSKQNGIQSHQFYTTGGDIVNTRRYYSEKDLAPFITAKVKAKFPRYTIFGITEIASAYGVNYTIVLEDTLNWLHIKSDEVGTITIVKKYRKA